MQIHLACLNCDSGRNINRSRVRESWRKNFCSYQNPSLPPLILHRGYAFIDLREGRGRVWNTDVRETLIVASHTCPVWVSNLQPRYVPWPESNLILLVYRQRSNPAVTNLSDLTDRCFKGFLKPAVAKLSGFMDHQWSVDHRLAIAAPTNWGIRPGPNPMPCVFLLTR